MVAISASFLICYLLATSRSGARGTQQKNRNGGAGRGRGRGRGGGGGRGNGNRNGNRNGNLGRKRYSRDGTKRKSENNQEMRKEEVYPLPPLTGPNCSRPFYFSTRHTYEHTLINEINRYANKCGGRVLAMSPYPGLVRVEDEDGVLPLYYDPVYALQSMPHAVVVKGDSIKGIAKEVSKALLGNDDEQNINIDEISLQLKDKIRKAPRGSLVVHGLVPGMCKGQMKPVMQHRSEKISEELAKMMKKMYAAARKAPTDDDGNIVEPNTKWLLQTMLQSPDIAVASLTECQHTGPGKNAWWPNTNHPLGLAKVDIEEKMPSSAYRKLMESLECMQIKPSSSTVVVDLGACPGGWTSVMRRLGCRVAAVDRSELDPVLMRDDKVDFFKADAFAFKPTVDEGQDCWMISDIIAYPERITELLEQWCSGHWASNLIVTMKFQGDEPDLDELHKAVEIVEGHGYGCRVKHFFNNKNEVTFMLSETGGTSLSLDRGSVGSAMYPITI